jgi:ABC-type Fe3+ transport system permease subunit
MVPMVKKKTHKKQSFKYAQPTHSTESSATSVVSDTAVIRSSSSIGARPSSIVTTVDNPFLSQDLAKLGVIAVALVVIEFGLWFAFGHTSLGSTIYNLYKIK